MIYRPKNTLKHEYLSQFLETPHILQLFKEMSSEARKILPIPLLKKKKGEDVYSYISQWLEISARTIRSEGIYIVFTNEYNAKVILSTVSNVLNFISIQLKCHLVKLL